MTFVARLFNSSSSSGFVNNMIYDALFHSSIDQSGNTIQGSKFFWWDEILVGTGVVKRQLQSAFSTGAKNASIKIETGATGTGTWLEQILYFHNYPEIHLPLDSTTGDKLSFSIWVKSTVANAGVFTVEFIDRNLQTDSGSVFNGTAQSLFTATPANNGSTINTWVQLKIENCTIPSKGSFAGNNYEGCIGVRVKFKASANNATVEFSEPMANIGSTAAPFQERIMDWTEYKGLEDFVYKLYRKQNVQIDNFGDSISQSNLASQGDKSAAPNFFSYICTWIQIKFGVTVTARNNAASGSGPANAMLLFQDSVLANSPDLIMIHHGRNVSSQSYNGSVVQNVAILESLARRAKTANPRVNFLMTLPFYRRMGPGGIGDAGYSNHQSDVELLKAMTEICSIYGGATANTANKQYNVGEKGLWQNYFAINTSSGDSTHPYWVGHKYHFNELQHVLWGSYLNRTTARNYSVPSVYVDQNGLSSQMQGATVLMSNRFMTPGTYQDGTGVSVTVNSVNGVWGDDTNFDSTQLSTNKRLVGVVPAVSGFGPYQIPKVSSSDGDYIEISWPGKYFAIFFGSASNRGNALITVNGIEYTLNTLDGSGNYKHVYPTFTNFLTGANPGGIAALPSGTNTIRIEQKDSGLISIVGLIFF